MKKTTLEMAQALRENCRLLVAGGSLPTLSPEGNTCTKKVCRFEKEIIVALSLVKVKLTQNVIGCLFPSISA
jgi:hypothetical protein